MLESHLSRVLLATVITSMFVINVAAAQADQQQNAQSEEQTRQQSDRPPLLREGSTIVDAIGRLEFDKARGVWKFIIQSGKEGVPPYELAVMPCTRLRELQRIVRTTGHENTTFQMTGRVFVFNKRNYLLPLHAPRIVSQRATSTDSQTTDDSNA